MRLEADLSRRSEPRRLYWDVKSETPPPAETLLKLLYEQTHHYAIVFTDVRGNVLHWPAGAQEIFGYEPDEVIGSHLSNLFTPDDMQRGIPEFERTVAMVNGGAHDDRWMMRKDRASFWANGVLVPLRDPCGNVVALAKIMRNRTDLKEQTVTLERANDALARSDANKSTFLSTLAHELRNPLQAISMAAMFLNRTIPATEDTELTLKTIQRQVDQMTRMVNDLLDVTRVRSGRLSLDLQRVSLRDVLSNALQVCEPLLRERHHQCELIAAASPVVIYADAARLQQIFVNLIENAAKYTDPGGSVWIKLATEGEKAVVRIEDTGIGIPADVLPRIFELFTQAEAQPARGRGLGIGLAVVKDLVALHGGTVQVVSDGPGKGSEFIVRLPLRRDGD
jgi:PAS domain S-box-containing protein